MVVIPPVVAAMGDWDDNLRNDNGGVEFVYIYIYIIDVRMYRARDHQAEESLWNR